MTTFTVAIILILISVLAFNTWNILTLKSLLKRPMKNDQLNDKSYWELKYKMQYMITTFSVILAIVAYLGYNTLDNVKNSFKEEFKLALDSTRTAIDSLNNQVSSSRQLITNTDSVLNSYQNLLLGLDDRSKAVKNCLSISANDLAGFKKRIEEINSKNIIQQNIYIVDNIRFMDTSQAFYEKYYFKDLLSNTGQRLPIFTKPPFILAISNEGSDMIVNNVTTESLELAMMARTRSSGPFNVTLFITQNP